MLLPAQLALAAWLAAGSAPGGGPPSPPDTAPLEFAGFRAGAHLDELDARVRRADRGRLRCQRASADPRVSECRGTVSDSALGGPIHIWISAMDSVAGVITLSAPVEAERLEQWRARIVRRYGQVEPRVQGSQRMMQWVRRGRMLRLTWRTDRKGTTASVSLVDGRVLDAWGHARAVGRRD
jgi:hypothetical protein